MNAVDWIALRANGSIGQFYDEIENNGMGLAVYAGFAPRGSLTSDAAWLITKFEYDVNGVFLRAKTSPQKSVWDNRASLTYA